MESLTKNNLCVMVMKNLPHYTWSTLIDLIYRLDFTGIDESQQVEYLAKEYRKIISKESDKS